MGSGSVDLASVPYALYSYAQKPFNSSLGMDKGVH
jgi:hypothetical protein